MSLDPNTWVYQALGVDVAGIESALSSGGPTAQPGPAGLSAETLASGDKYLRDHRFKATKREEIVPGDMQCDVWLDDHLVKQDDVSAALVKAIPAVSQDPVGLAHFVADRWDLEIHQALVFSGKMPPPKAPEVRSAPDGLLGRYSDGQTFWSPAPLATMGGSETKPGDDWTRSFLTFYDLGPAADGGDGVEFNGAPDTLDHVAKTAAEQAVLAGYRADAQGARTVAKQIVDARSQAREQGAAAAKQVGGTSEPTFDTTALNAMKMPALLDALTEFRKTGQLDKLKRLNNSQRVNAAILAVEHLDDKSLDEPFKQNFDTLGDDDRNAIIHYLYGRIVTGDMADPNDDTSASPSAEAAKPKDDGLSGQQSAAMQYAGHWKFVKINKVPKLAPNNPPYDVTFQVQLAANYAAHVKDGSGPEVQALVQLGYNQTNGQITVLGGVQGALVQSFWKGVVQTSEFIQAIAGSASDGNSRTGQFQASVGGQVLIKISVLGISVGGQIGTGFTATQGSPVDLPVTGTAIIQGEFP
jgi:hypothetical protein